MSLVDPTRRSAAGAAAQGEIEGAPAPEPRTPLAASWRDFVFAEVWTRPGLDRRARYLISLASAAIAGGGAHALERYVRGALDGKVLTLAELREAALHLAVYAGWIRGGELDAAVDRVAGTGDFDIAPFAPIQSDACDPQARLAAGARVFQDTMAFAAPPPLSPFLEAGILNFVFAEMWVRPGLDQRSRRWITLVGVCDSAAPTPIQSHIHAAMASGNCTEAELHEFVLQYAIHAGWPKAAAMQGVVAAMAKKVAAGLPYNG